MRLFIYSTDIEATLKGDFVWSLNASSDGELGGGGWVLVGHTEVDLDINREDLTKTAIKDLDEKIKEVEATMTATVTELKSRQQNLLALTNDSGGVS